MADQLPYFASSVSPLADQVDNPDALASYGAGFAPGDMMAMASLPASSHDYLILTNNDVATSTADYTLDDFVTHKVAMGFQPGSVIIATVDAYTGSSPNVIYDDIYTDYTGVDNAEKIRNFIIDAYSTWGIDYVLLAGDTNVIPEREFYIYAGSKYGEVYYASDMYYQCLDGPFNYDGDGNWAERNDGAGGGDVDLAAEVFIGRASAEDGAEMANWLYKTITYELDTDSEHRWHALMNGRKVDAITSSKDHLEEIRLGSDNWGYTTDGFADEDRFVSEYPDDTLYYDDGVYAQPQKLMASMNTDGYGIFNDVGHSTTTQALGLWANASNSMTNDNFFFAYSHGCNPGEFELNCAAEDFTTNNRHGAFAVIFNSDYGWYYKGSTSGPAQRVNRQFWDAAFSEEIEQLGAMNADSHEDALAATADTYVRAAVFATNLFGDPSLSIISNVFELGAVDGLLAYHNESNEIALRARNGVGAHTWSITSGSLPAGLSLDANTGVISGTPTTLGDSPITVQVVDSQSHSDSEAYTVSVAGRLEFVVGAQLPDASIGVAYQTELTAQGGSGALAWIGFGVPAGLTVNESTGVLSGVPEAQGSYHLIVRLEDSGIAKQISWQEFDLDVVAPATEIHGQAFNDSDGDGVQDAGEEGRDGWTIELYDRQTGELVATTITASVDLDESETIEPETESGLYSFTGLSAGYYDVRVVAPSWLATTSWEDGRMFTVQIVTGEGLCIVEMDPVHGFELSHFSVPVPPLYNQFQGLAVGPESIFYLDGSGVSGPELWELNMDTGLPVDGSQPDVLTLTAGIAGGLAYLNGLIYIQEFNAPNTWIHVWNPQTSTLVNSFAMTPLLIGGLAAAPDVGGQSMLFASDTSGVVYRINPATGAVLSSFDPALGVLDGGMAFNDGELWASPYDFYDISIYRLNPLTGALIGEFDPGLYSGYGPISGLGGDGVVHFQPGLIRVDLAWGNITTVDDFGLQWDGPVGDVDYDGDIDADDIDLVYANFGGPGTFPPQMDIDEDGDCDSDDVTFLVRNILGTEFGDADLDGYVNAADLGELNRSYGMTGVGWANANFNGDGVVNSTDLAIVGTYIGFIAVGNPDRSVVVGPPKPDETAWAIEVDSGVARIVEFGIDDGLLYTAFSTPQNPTSTGYHGLAVGPDSLFYIDGSNLLAPTVWELDLSTGAVLDSDVLTFNPIYAIKGDAYLSGELFIQYLPTEIAVWNPTTDSLVRTISVPGEDLAGGLAAVNDPAVIFAGNAGGEILKIDPANGTVLARLTPNAGPFNGGLAYVNGELLAVSTNTAWEAVRIDPTTGNILGYVTIGAGLDLIVGLAGNGEQAVGAMGGDGDDTATSIGGISDELLPDRVLPKAARANGLGRHVSILASGRKAADIPGGTGDLGSIGLTTGLIFSETGGAAEIDAFADDLTVDLLAEVEADLLLPV
jgi:hypothetical protein